MYFFLGLGLAPLAMSEDASRTALQVAFGARVRQLRKEKGYTQDDLGARMDMDRAHVSRLESGQWMPTLEMMIRVAKGLDLPLADLVAGLEDG